MPSEADLANAYRGRTVCVTGGAGFIGAHLCRALVEHEARVTVLDDLSTGLESNLDSVADRVRFIRGSILVPETIAAATTDVECVFHLAAATSVPASVDDPERSFRVNALGTMRVLEAMRAAGGRRIVFSASSSAYGDQPGQPRVETMPPDTPSPYAVSKCAGEQLLRAYAVCYGLETISLRYFNIFGSGQRPDSPYAAVIPLFARAMLAGERPLIYGDGEQTRDFTPVANAVRANLLAGACAGPLSGQMVNIACGRTLSVRELGEAMAAMIGVRPDFEFAPARPGDVFHSQASIERARELLGYEPIVSFEDGLAETIEYYRALFA
ncbi:MAG: NAD-dependent epimerase/dehydratase family protein [Planctomycetes bacterium]|nr:NAD-dependent epimerase/dehydratase family protein [Planctomycetota bacterium]